MDSIETSCKVKHLFDKEKTKLNFTNRSNDDFLKFLLNTAKTIVEHFKPVIDEVCYKDISPVVSSTSLYQSPGKKQRLNQDRFKTEQVNKLVDTEATHIPVSDDAACNPKHNKENLKPVPKSGTNTTTNISYNIFKSPLKLRNLSPVSSPSRKFFSDVRTDEVDEPYIPHKIKQLSGESPKAVSPLYKSEMSQRSSIKHSEISRKLSDTCNKFSSNSSELARSSSKTLHHSKPNKPSNILHFNLEKVTSYESKVSPTVENTYQHLTKTCKTSVCNVTSEQQNTVSSSGISVPPKSEDSQQEPVNRRVTDCGDKMCKFCPSYDAAYASCFQEMYDEELQSLEEAEESEKEEKNTDKEEETYDLLIFKSASEDIEPRKTSPDAKGALVPPRDQEDLQITHYGSSLEVDDAENQTIYSWRDWSLVTGEGANSTIVSYHDNSNHGDNSNIVVPDHISKLSNKELRTHLIAKGAHVGAITPSTRTIYEQYLVKLETCPVTLDESLEGYPRELLSCLQGQPQTDWSAAEQLMVQEFQCPVLGRRYRQGTKKCFFNYLLLDPRVADDLPQKAEVLNPIEIFKLFIKSVFYIGKGKQSRPYAHLFEASLKNKDNEKLRKIRDIWAGGRGVVSLHVYNNTIAEEAFTREAVMITCMGMKKLSNEKAGEFYGVSKTWTIAKKRGVGLALLYKAHLTLLNEGLREIREADICKS